MLTRAWMIETNPYHVEAYKNGQPLQIAHWPKNGSYPTRHVQPVSRDDLIELRDLLDAYLEGE